ncbi:MAG: 30S ribosomal protein S1 [Bacteroidetes bacterium ADurb.Bin408]|nr:MAG: 30S ribosomal protein S1 [Bacteroidetes bacterium ADurb.Bin408]
MNEEVEKTNEAENNENEVKNTPENVVESNQETTEEKPAETVTVEKQDAAPVEEKKHKEKSGRKEAVNYANVQPLDDFDWDSIGKKQEKYPEAERLKMQDLYDKTLNAIGDHEVLEGTVVSKNNREVVVNIGFKSDGVIPVSELRYNPDFKIGDKIEVYVESQEDLTGQLLLSHKKARVLRSWERVNKALEDDEIINGYIKCRTKGGLIVDVFGIEAFLPGSQIDVKPIRDYDVFVGQTMEFKVVKINHEFKNVVVSHKALIEAELEQQKAEIISKLEKGQILEGTVKNITSYGVFIDLGGVDGLIHITDLSWGRINHPEEIVKLDSKINVVILDFDDNKKRIALGLKQLTPHPWDALSADLKVGDKVKGKVVVIADYGAFIEIAPGVEGLIHVSEMSWSQHLRTAQDFLKVGDEVEAVILTLDREERKMSLGIKQLIPDPWANITEKYPVNSRHKAKVRNFTNFGIFVELEEGVDGLIHISDLSWSKKIKHPAEFTKIDDQIEVIVLEIDTENRRLSLGHKQLEENPWDVFESVFTVDSVHQGTIVSQGDKGVIVSLPYGVEGFAPLRHIVKEDGKQAKIDETLEFKVIEFAKEQKKIIVSHTKFHQDIANETKAKEQAENMVKEKQTAKNVKKISDNIEKTTLGDLSVLSNLKNELEESEKNTAKEKLKKMSKKAENTDSENKSGE